MTPSRVLLGAAALCFLGGSFLLASTGEPRGLAACVVGLLVGAGALGMLLAERRSARLSPEQEARVACLVREGHTLRAVRRLREVGGNDLRTAYRYVRRLERRDRRHERAERDPNLWWV